jgi:glycosyltransferase involved in cell wall biosynthesis
VRITFILWRGDIGGAERVTVALAGQMRRMSIDASVLFVCDSAHLGSQLASENVPHESLGLGRGGEVLVHPARLRTIVGHLRPDVVIPVAVGYLGATLRATGFRGPIIGVEHGPLIDIASGSRTSHLKRWADRLSGVVTYDAEIAISRYMLDLVARGPRVPRVVLIPHGVQTASHPPPLPAGGTDELTVGFVGRLFPGKGLDRLLRAVAIVAHDAPTHKLTVRVAGDGEMRPAWEQLARDLGIHDRVEFVGWTDDVVGHWSRCHIAAAPNDEYRESFGMSVLESMACGRATIVSDIGALPELVVANRTGRIVPAGNERVLATVLLDYIRNGSRIRSEGAAAHRRASADYSLVQAAEKYLGLADELLVAARGHPWRVHRSRAAR